VLIKFAILPKNNPIGAAIEIKSEKKYRILEVDYKNFTKDLST